MNARQDPPIVAELGRPETAEEIAARKAETSRTHRESQTFRNLLVALLASLAVVVVTVLVVVRPDLPPAPAIDYRAIAAEADSPAPLAVPDLPQQWKANSAVFDAKPADGVATWYMGFITPKQQFIGVRQGIDANPTWLANQLKNRTATESTTIGGVAWQVYDNRTARDAGNLAYAMSTSDSRGAVVLFGTADVDEFATMAAVLSAVLESQ